MKNTVEIGEALRAYLMTKASTQKEIADMLGISPQHLSNYFRGVEQISRKVADRIVELWPEIRHAFLMSGDGELLNSAPIQHVNNSGQISGGIVNVQEGAALRQQVADLQARLEKSEQEKARLLGIIETITTK